MGGNGTPDFNIIVPLFIRARWKPEAFNILLKHCKYHGSGDALLGRMLAFLNPLSADFATLPPHFAATVPSDEVDTLVSVVFRDVKHPGAR